MPPPFNYSSLGGRYRQPVPAQVTAEMEDQATCEGRQPWDIPGPSWKRIVRPQAYSGPLPRIDSAVIHFGTKRRNDIAFDCLLRMVPLISKTSAVPITIIMCDELSQAQILELVSDIKVKAPANATKHGAKKFSSADLNLVSVGAKSRKSHDEARVKLSEKLRKHGMVDVEVAYKCAMYTPAPLNADMDSLNHLGGWAYGRCCYREKEAEMAFDVICTRATLDKVFPAERLADETIIIRTNTVVALPEPPPERLHLPGPGTMFPNDIYDPNESPEVKMQRVMDEIASHQKRNDASIVDKVRAIKKNPDASWFPYSSASRTENPRPDWSGGKAPFIRLPGEADRWWEDDLREKRMMLATTSGSQLVPLSDVYPANRSEAWHKANIENSSQGNSFGALSNFQLAEAVYLQDIAKVEKFYQRFVLACVQATQRNDGNLFNMAMQKLREAEFHVKRAQGEYVQKAKECGREPDPAKLRMPGQLYDHTMQIIEQMMQGATQAEPESPSTPPNFTPSERADTPVVQGFTTDSTAASQASSYAEKQLMGRVDTPRPGTPFPAYRDPIAMRMQDLAATQQNISRPIVDRLRAQRTNTSRELSNIMMKGAFPDPRIASGTPPKLTADVAMSKP